MSWPILLNFIQKYWFMSNVDLCELSSIPNIVMWWPNFHPKKVWEFFLYLVKCSVFDQPTVDSGGVSRGWSVTVAVGCWLFALQQHFNSTSMALQQHVNDISTAFPQHINKEKKERKKKRIDASIRIRQEIQCLPYAGFFFYFFILVIVLTPHICTKNSSQ